MKKSEKLEIDEYDEYPTKFFWEEKMCLAFEIICIP